MKGLLGQLEELAWNLPPGSFSPTTPDLLGDGERPPRAGVGVGGGMVAHRTGVTWTGRERPRVRVGRASPPPRPTPNVLCPRPPLEGAAAWHPDGASGRAVHGSPGSHPAPPGAQRCCLPHWPSSRLKAPGLLSGPLQGTTPAPPQNPPRARRRGCPLPLPQFPVTGLGGGAGPGSGAAGGLQRSRAVPSLSDGFGAPELELPGNWK